MGFWHNVEKKKYNENTFEKILKSNDYGGGRNA